MNSSEACPARVWALLHMWPGKGRRSWVLLAASSPLAFLPSGCPRLWLAQKGLRCSYAN